MMVYRKAMVALCAGMLFVLPMGLSHAAELVLPISSAVSSTEDGITALLVKFEGLDRLDGVEVLYAKCLLSLSVDSCDGQRPELLIVPIRESPRLSNSNARATLDSTGTSSTEPLASVADVQLSRDGLVELLITQYIRDAIKAQLAVGAVLLVPTSDSKDCRFDLSTAAASVDMSGGKLIIKYVERLE